MASFEIESNDSIVTASTGIIGVNSGQLSSITDKDVFKFTLTESAVLGMKFGLPSGADSNYFTINILDAYGNTIFSNIGGADFSNINFSAAAGTYFIEISANTIYLNANPVDAQLVTNQYDIAVSSLPSVNAIGEIESNDTAVSATQILLGSGTPLVSLVDTSIVIGNLTSVADKDFFTFSVDQSGLYTFKFVAPTNILPDAVSPDPSSTIKEFFKISILDANENVLVSHYVSDTTVDGYIFDFGADYVGQYFVKIENGGSTTNINTQQYNFEINSVEPSAATSTIVNGASIGDYLLGTSTSDVIQGFAGNDILSGMAGNDRLDGGIGVDTMKGGTGNDTYILDSKSDLVIENSAAGTDKVITSVNYTLTKNVENLVLDQAILNAKGVLSGATLGTGNVLDNILVGNQLANTLTGLAGDDTLDGGFGLKADTLVGGAGNDTYYINNTLDKIVESSGAGVDLALAKVDVLALAANVENLKLLEMGINADGSPIAAYGFGNSLANTITGNNEVNQLYGLAGNDTLYGRGGNDALIGGAGNDSLVGGLGSDYFIFDTTLSSVNNVDSIVDFISGVDVIQLSKTIFKKLVGDANSDFDGDLSADNFIIGTVAADANDFIVYNQATGDLYYDADGNGVSAAVKFANLTGGVDLVSTDFTVL